MVANGLGNEEAAEKFDRILEVDANKNSEPSVSKMLADNGEVESRPYRSRTCDTLVKSQANNFGVVRLNSCRLHENNASLANFSLSLSWTVLCLISLLSGRIDNSPK